ncbi:MULTISPECIES: hypothetical protein [Bacteroidales]|uniref:hypothetical protein n=1 Tax=Bacteroidales TaxID=171549 RepID=UPI0013D4E362|nr:MULTISPECIES: hypothetical protein [Bacteroidales]MDH6313101.1 hypothetical protein [Parabacteroides sp. PFB2-10]NDV82873.1 hypothetical protein [Bacteroides sp. 51]
MVIIVITSVQLYSQTKKGLGFDIAMYDYNETGLHYSIFYNWDILKNLVFSTGISYFTNEVNAGWFSNDNTSYNLGEKNRRVNGAIASTVVVPVFKKAGLLVTCNVLFDIVPFNYISIDKGLKVTEGHTIEPIGKYVFTQFNPGAFVDIGLYYDMVKNDARLRLMVSMGYGIYDPVREYRRTTIDNQKLGDYISENKSATRISFKIIGYW